MAKAKKQPTSVVYGSRRSSAETPSKGNRLRTSDASTLEHGSKSSRILATIKRDMDLKGRLFLTRLRNEQILALDYDGSSIGGSDMKKNLRENFLNLPFRYDKWLKSQATSKKMVVKVSRDAGAGQRPSGPADSETGMWTAISITRVAYVAGFNREMSAVIGEVCPRGTSVMRIGYHDEAITLDQAAEVGKDAQSVIPEVLAEGDTEAKPGQAHAEISAGLATMAQSPGVVAAVGKEGVTKIVARKDSHDVADFKQETDDKPSESTRPIQHRIWMRKLRAGEDCGWSPHVYDIEDAGMWWQRFVWTVAQVKASPLFTKEFRAKAADYCMDARTDSKVASGGRMPGVNSMGADARQAQSEDLRDDDEKSVEWFQCWFRRPNTKAGGIVKIVCAACPDEFVQSDDSNPHVFTNGDRKGYGSIPGFFPFYDFTPIKPTLPIPESTCGVPLIAVGMPQAEKIAEYGRLRHESALRHAHRMYQKHPGLKGNTAVNNALKNGTDGFSFDCPPACVNSDGKMVEAIIPIQFTGNTQEIERQSQKEEGDWVKVMGMPPAVLQGMGTAGTAAQDNMGLAAGERESGALVGYFEQRTADVLSGVRGLMRGCYDDEDFIALLGEEGGAVMKRWQEDTVDDGDEIEVAFGASAQAEKTVRTKQVMEAIAAEKAEIDPITGLEKYDHTALFEELHRLLDVGKPILSVENQTELERLAMIGKQALAMMQAAQGVKPGAPSAGQAAGGKPTMNGSGKPPHAGPNPSEGDGPKQENLAAGAARGTKVPS